MFFLSLGEKKNKNRNLGQGTFVFVVLCHFSKILLVITGVKGVNRFAWELRVGSGPR